MNYNVYLYIFVILLVAVFIFALLQFRAIIRRCKKANTRLKRKGENRYKDLANLLPQLVVEFDHNGHFIFINDIGRDFIGYSTYEIGNDL